MEASNNVLFIDCEEKPLAVVKEERSPTPEERSKRSKSSSTIQCVECPYISKSADRMTRHIRTTHRGEKPYQCSICKYATTNSVMYKEHVNTHLGIKPYQCSLCPYRTVSKKYIKLHEQKHRQCSCGFIAKNRPEFNRHVREKGCSHIKTEEDVTETKKRTRKFKCQPCGKSYSDANALSNHQNTHKKCPYCAETFSRENIKKHIKDAHASEVPKKFLCKICPWASNRLQKFLLHLIHHPGQEVDYSVDVTPLVSSGISIGYSVT